MEHYKRVGFVSLVAVVSMVWILAGIQRFDFCVVATGGLGKAFTDNLAVAHQHTTHRRVGTGAVNAAAGQADGAGHHLGIEGGRHGTGRGSALGGLGVGICRFRG